MERQLVAERVKGRKERVVMEESSGRVSKMGEIFKG